MKRYYRDRAILSLYLALSSACGADSGSLEDDDVIREGDPANLAVQPLEKMEESVESEILELDGHTLYLGLVLGDGPVAEIIPSIRDHGSLEAALAGC